MEQKHIDEIDESFLGEEFIDEEEISIEKVQEELDKKHTKKAKKTAIKKTEKVSEDDVKITIIKDDEPLNPEPKVKELKQEPKIEVVSDSLKEEKAEPVKVQDPWDDGADDDGFFKDASTWKAITGIAVILLLLSIFTQGFSFSEQANTPTASLTLSEAEQKAVNYVNTNLLRPPFLAEIVGSVEEAELFKITLNVAGESVDSYLSKDGKLFFPQGFDVDAPLEVLDSVELEEVVVEDKEIDKVMEELEDGMEDEYSEEMAEVQVTESGLEETTKQEGVNSSEKEVVINPVEEPVAQKPVGATSSFTLQAKKWLFTPHQLTVNQGDTVELTLIPSGLDFTFAVPGLGVEQDVSGTTAVSFTADTPGSYEFKCSSCEDWRGMSGTIVVK
jgi:plastocyanin